MDNLTGVYDRKGDRINPPAEIVAVKWNAQQQKWKWNMDVFQQSWTNAYIHLTLRYEMLSADFTTYHKKVSAIIPNSLLCR
jgi:hypothetical protein